MIFKSRYVAVGMVVGFFLGCQQESTPVKATPLFPGPAEKMESADPKADVAHDLGKGTSEVPGKENEAPPDAQTEAPKPLSPEDLDSLEIKLTPSALLVGGLRVELKKSDVQTLIDYLNTETTKVEQPGRYDAYVFGKIGIRCLVLRETSAVTFFDVSLARKEGAELSEVDPEEVFRGKLTVFGVPVTPATKREDFKKRGIDPRDFTLNDGFGVNSETLEAGLNHPADDPSQITSVRINLH